MLAEIVVTYQGKISMHELPCLPGPPFHAAKRKAQIRLKNGQHTMIINITSHTINTLQLREIKQL